jgi:hypothetical protein
MEDKEGLFSRLKEYLSIHNSYDTSSVYKDTMEQYKDVLEEMAISPLDESEYRIPIKLGQDKLLNWLRKRSTSICDSDFDLITKILCQGYYNESNKGDLNRIRIKWSPLYQIATNK